MRTDRIVAIACPLCGNATSPAAIEQHPTDLKLEWLTFHCSSCGSVRSVSRPRQVLHRAA